jgi:hypothetical protein
MRAILKVFMVVNKRVDFDDFSLVNVPGLAFTKMVFEFEFGLCIVVNEFCSLRVYSY